jgi:hypothetical protein
LNSVSSKPKTVYGNQSVAMQDFSFIADEHTRVLVANGYEAVSQLELWGWLRAFEPNPNEGFMWSSDPNITSIGNKMHEINKDIGHSGGSFGFTMRTLHYIARNGIDKYKQLVLQR